MREAFQEFWGRWGTLIICLMCLGGFVAYMHGPSDVCSSTLGCGFMFLGWAGWIVLVLFLYIASKASGDISQMANLTLGVFMAIATGASAYTAWVVLEQSRVDRLLSAYPLVQFVFNQDDLSIYAVNNGRAPATIKGIDLMLDGKIVTVSNILKDVNTAAKVDEMLGNLMNRVFRRDELTAELRSNGKKASFAFRAYDLAVGQVIPAGSDAKIKLFSIKMNKESETTLDELKDLNWAIKFGSVKDATVDICYCSAISPESQCFFSEMTTRGFEQVPNCNPIQQEGRAIYP